MKIRIVEPEILDSLAEDETEALANRRDLRWLNFLMGNFRWIHRRLRSCPPRSWLEIGAGRGELCAYLAKKEALSAGAYTALDLCSRPADLPNGVEWRQENLLSEQAFPPAEGLIANLILHQFTDEELIGLRKKIEAFDVLIINEPARRAVHQYQLLFCKALGFCHTSMHDGRVSINAGFCKNELVHLLGLQTKDWSIQVHTTTLGGYRLFAQRRRA